jgi:hypothetical protein
MSACPNLALWQRTASLNANHIQEFLCEAHYDVLLANRPLVAYHYEQIQEKADEKIPHRTT